ncbi:MAG: hypothetical protein ABSH47_27415, partial [Bryobacteraceae bacterium]
MIPTVSLVNTICLPPDAISQALLWKLRVLEQWKREGRIRDVRVFTYNANIEHPAIRVIPSLEALLTDAYFCASEVAFYSFGIHNDLLNTVFLRAAPQLTFVQYHNITPERLVRNEAHRVTVRRGLAQRANLHHVDHVFADSPLNRQDLVEFGIPSERISVLPLPLTKGFPPGPIRVRPKLDEVRILFVGRFVPAKGLMDLVEAIRVLHCSGLGAIHVRLVGDLTYFDPDYLQSVRDAIKEWDLGGIVTVVGSVSHD